MGRRFVIEKQKQEKIISLCQKLIRAKSYSGQEDKAAGVLREEMEGTGFDSVNIDRYGNIIGCIKGKRPGKKVLFDGHIDTVPVGDESAWASPPFAAEIRDGKIYGRGTSDMKGAVAAFVSAAEFFAENTNRDFAGEVYVAGVVHEECFEGVAAREISKAVSPDYVIIGEASQLNLKIGQRGRKGDQRGIQNDQGNRRDPQPCGPASSCFGRRNSGTDGYQIFSLSGRVGGS